MNANRNALRNYCSKLLQDLSWLFDCARAIRSALVPSGWKAQNIAGVAGAKSAYDDLIAIKVELRYFREELGEIKRFMEKLRDAQ